MNGRVIRSPINYTGNKWRLIPQIAPLLPRGERFVDMFAGSLTVGLNAGADNVWFNDECLDAMELGRTLRETEAETLITEVDQVVADYGLSSTVEHGYAYYGTTGTEGLMRVNREAYRKLREDFNRQPPGRRRSILFFTTLCFAFNCQVRYNRRGEFNMPGGKWDFHAKLRGRVYEAHARLSGMTAAFSSLDFRDMFGLTSAASVIYADPPYLLGEATYNDGWTEVEERALFDGLDAHAERGGQFALSNVAEHRGVEHHLLIEWIQAHPEYEVHELDASYANASYHRLERSGSREVLVVHRL